MGKDRESQCGRVPCCHARFWPDFRVSAFARRRRERTVGGRPTGPAETNPESSWSRVFFFVIASSLVLWGSSPLSGERCKSMERATHKHRSREYGVSIWLPFCLVHAQATSWTMIVCLHCLCAYNESRPPCVTAVEPLPIFWDTRLGWEVAVVPTYSSISCVGGVCVPCFSPYLPRNNIAGLKGRLCHLSYRMYRRTKMSSILFKNDDSFACPDTRTTPDMHMHKNTQLSIQNASSLQ